MYMYQARYYTPFSCSGNYIYMYMYVQESLTLLYSGISIFATLKHKDVQEIESILLLLHQFLELLEFSRLQK